jgi:hypothetical protein
MSAARGIVAELDAVVGMIARAETDLTTDTIVDLSPLEPVIEELCCRIESLPPEAGRDMQPRLLSLIDDFGRLSRSIDKKMGDIKREMGGATGRRQAMTAYTKHPGSNK